MQSLSDDIIIMICQYVTLLDAFHLCLTNRRLATLVVSYGKAIAPFVVSNTFPNANLLRHDVLKEWTTISFRLQRQRNIHIDESAWLEGVVHKYLASLVVERFYMLHSPPGLEFRGIPAEAEAGNAHRKRAESGWRILSELSKISHDVYALPIYRVRLLPRKERLKRIFGYNKTLSNSSERLAILERRERMILEQRLQYLESLDAQLILDYRFTISCMLAALRTNHDRWRWEYPSYFGVRPEKFADRFDWGGDHDSRRIQKGNSWVNWFIMHEDPALFWKQWKFDSADENFVRGKVWQAWKHRADQQIAIERCAVCTVETFLRNIAGFKEYSILEPVDEFKDYQTHREIRAINNLPPSHEEIFKDVKYGIEFRGWTDKLPKHIES